MANTNPTLAQRVEAGRAKIEADEVERIRREALEKIQRGELTIKEGDRVITDIVKKGGKLGDGYGAEGGGMGGRR